MIPKREGKRERERRSEYNIEAAKFTRKKGIQLIAAAAAADDHQSSWGEEAPAAVATGGFLNLWLAGWLAGFNNLMAAGCWFGEFDVSLVHGFIVQQASKDEDETAKVRITVPR